MRSSVVSAAAVAAILAAPARADVLPFHVVNYREGQYHLGCTQELHDYLTPADLYGGAAQCVADEKYADGVLPYMLAVAYGLFDQARVADATAHGVIGVLQTKRFAFIDEEKMKKFGAARAAVVDDKSERRKLCEKLRAIGKPDYDPRYMTGYGKKSYYRFMGVNPLVPDFDAKAAWERILTSEMRCEGRGS
jgi:hypothetical protein